MQIILTKRVRNLGNIGDIVTVKPGYGRNYLFPMNMAVRANRANIQAFEERREELEKAELTLLATANQRAEQLRGLRVTIAAQAAEEGKLYGSVGVRDIAKAITDAGFQVDKAEISVPDGPIRSIGEFTINVLLHLEVEADVLVNIVEKK
jgi:large subunit ribosomal protein L9